MDDASDAGSLFRVTGAAGAGGGGGGGGVATKNELVARGGSGGALALSRAPVGGSASPAPAPLPQPAPSPAPAALPPPALPPPTFRADTPHRANGAHIPAIEGHAAAQFPARPVGAASGPETPERPANNKPQPGARAAADSPTPAPPAPPAPSPIFPTHTAYQSQSQSHAAAALPDYRHTNHETRSTPPAPPEPPPPAPLDLHARPAPADARHPAAPTPALSVPTSFPSRINGAAPHSTPSAIPAGLPSQPLAGRPHSPVAPTSRPSYPPPAIGSSHVNSSISSGIHGHTIPYQSQASLQKHSVQSVYASRPSHLAPFSVAGHLAPSHVPTTTASQPLGPLAPHHPSGHSIASHATSHRPPSNPGALPTSTPNHMGLPPAGTAASYPAGLKHPGLSSVPPHAPPAHHPASLAEAAAASSAPAIVTSAATGAAHPLVPVSAELPARAASPAALATAGFPPPAVYPTAAYPPLYAPYATTLQHSSYLPPAAASPRNITDTRTSLSASPLVAPKTPKGVRPHTPGSTGAAGAALTSYSPRGPSPTRERESFSNISSLSRSTPSSSAPVSAPLAPPLVAPLAAPLAAPLPAPIPTPLAPLAGPLVPLAAPTPTPAAPSHLPHSLAPVPTIPSISSSAKPPAHWGVTRPTPAERAGFAPAPPLFGAPLAPPNPSPFSAESLFQTSPGADLLRRELDSRFLAAAGAAGAVREMHHHQHQHTHVHQHPPPPAPHPHHPHHLLVPHPPMFKDVSKMSSLYRSGIGLGYPYSPSLLHPAAPYVPPTQLSYAPTKKSGKWNAMHVRIAWEIYNHQQKEKSGNNSAAAAAAAAAAASEKDKLRALGAPPPPAAYRSPYELPAAPYLPHHPHLGARYDERAAYAASLHHADRVRVAGVSPFARYGPAGYPAAPPHFPLSAYGLSSLHGVHHPPLAPLHDPWRTPPAAARAPPPLPAPALDAARRDHEERERARRDREERERRDRDERERRKAREQRDRDMERARVRSPLRNGAVEPIKEERKELARHALPYGPPAGAAWDPYRAFDPLQHMRFAPLVEAAIRAEEDRAKMLSAYAHHQQLKASPLARLPHGLPMPPLDLLKKEEQR